MRTSQNVTLPPVALHELVGLATRGSSAAILQIFLEDPATLMQTLVQLSGTKPRSDSNTNVTWYGVPSAFVAVALAPPTGATSVAPAATDAQASTAATERRRARRRTLVTTRTSRLEPGGSHFDACLPSVAGQAQQTLNAGSGDFAPIDAYSDRLDRRQGVAVDFRLLGPIEVVGDAGPVRLGGENARAILAALMLHRARAVSWDTLVHAVWEDPPPTARHAVAVYVSRLRQAVATADGGRQRIVTRGTGYALEIEPEELDVEVFRAAAARGREAIVAGDGATAWTTLGDALDMWRATPMACLMTSPLIEARIDLEDERLSVLEDRLDAGLELGLHLELISELRTLTRQHPERERSWSALMLALYRSGRQADALEVFREARTTLRDAFGLEPGTAIRELQRRILDQDPALELARPRPAAISLPSPPSSFIGREHDLEDAQAVLSEAGARLLTIVGPGGLGKTRFALELGRRLAGRYPDGVTWVALDALDDPAQVIRQVSVAFGADGAAQDPLASVSDAIRGTSALLVLDCFEHVLAAAADVHRLLERVPLLHVLATSRERLGLSGEHLFWLPPLTPDDAATLFAARARAVSTSSLPDADVVAEVCERLDRLPLAIELVASQLQPRTREGLFATLERSLDVDGRRDPTTRHRTIRTTLDWSHALLDEDARCVLRRLSVFAGGFTLEAAEGVTDATRAGIERLECKSLVAPRGDRGRYRLLDTIRSYASEQLDASGEADLVRDRHASWFTDLARSIEPPTWIDASADGHAAFDADLPNFRIAFEHALENADGRSAASVVRSLAPYLYSKVSRRDGRQLARSTLSLVDMDPVDRGHVLYYDAAISMDMGLADETRAALAEAEALFGEADDPHGLSMVENLRCFHEASLGNYRESQAAGERASGYARDAGSEALDEMAKGHLAFALLGLGADAGARDEAALLRCLDLSRSAVRQAEASGNPYALLLAHGNIVSPLLELGDLEQALTHLRRAVELKQLHHFDLPYMVIDGADAASRFGEHETAVQLLSCGLVELARNDVTLQAYTSRRAEAIRSDARTALGPHAFRDHERAGKAMTVADALQLALTLAPARGAPVSSR